MECKNTNCEFCKDLKCFKHKEGIAVDLCGKFFKHQTDLSDIWEWDTVSVIFPFIAKGRREEDFTAFNKGDICVVCEMSNGFCSLLRLSDRAFAKTIRLELVERIH